MLYHYLPTYCCQELHCQKTDGRLKKKNNPIPTPFAAGNPGNPCQGVCSVWTRRCPAEEGLLLVHLQNRAHTNCLTYGRFGRLLCGKDVQNSLAFPPSHPLFSFFSLFTEILHTNVLILACSCSVCPCVCWSSVEKWVEWFTGQFFSDKTFRFSSCHLFSTEFLFCLPSEYTNVTIPDFGCANREGLREKEFKTFKI